MIDLGKSQISAALYQRLIAEGIADADAREVSPLDNSRARCHNRGAQAPIARGLFGWPYLVVTAYSCGQRPARHHDRKAGARCLSNTSRVAGGPLPFLPLRKRGDGRMLTALDGDGKRVIARKASRTNRYLCPECKQPLTFKAGRVVVWHFAHHPYAACPLSEGESLRHMEMKEQAGKLFDSDNYEVKLMASRRADLVIFDGIVVECQESSLSIQEWESRTKDYNAAGYPVLWLWDAARLGTPNERLENRIPAEIRHCHDRSQGRVYVLDQTGRLFACHFQPVERRESEWYEEGGIARESSYTPTTLRYTHFRQTPLRPTPIVNDKLVLVGLGDNTWWIKQSDRDEW